MYSVSIPYYGTWNNSGISKGIETSENSYYRRILNSIKSVFGGYNIYIALCKVTKCFSNIDCYFFCMPVLGIQFSNF